MDGRNGKMAGVVLVLALLLIAAADVSNASFLSKIRKMVAALPLPTAADSSNTTGQVSPSPSPDPVATIGKTNPDEPDHGNKTSNGTSSLSQDPNPKPPDKKASHNSTKLAKPPVQSVSENSTKAVDAKSNASSNSNHTDVTVAAHPLPPPPHPHTQKGNDKETGKKEEGEKHQNKKKNDQAANNKYHHDSGSPSSSDVVGPNCTKVPRRCRDQKSMVACILQLDTGSGKLLLLVQNEGEGTLAVDLSAPNPVDNALLEIAKHRSKQMELALGSGNQVILKAGNGECVLHLDPHISEGNFFMRLPSYDKLVTPVNGAYFLIGTVVIFGGMWACCILRKSRRQGGVAYQELEMGLPESSLANVETAEGWDQGWDDDWNEENAVKSPAARHVGNISANGLTSRSNRDGWDNDWDD